MTLHSALACKLAFYYVIFVTFTTDTPILQEIITNFYDNFGVRLRFIRLARNLTLTELSGGSASTAQSWESGIYPRTKRWTALAAMLKLSEPFVFKGIPSTEEDYDFIRQCRNQIGDAPSRWSRETTPSNIRDGGQDAEAQDTPHLADTNTIREHMQPWYEAMARNPNAAPYVLSQLRKNLPHDDLKLF